MGAPISPRARIERLRAFAHELHARARAETDESLRRMLDVEAYAREDQALALEEWLKGGASSSTGRQGGEGSA